MLHKGFYTMESIIEVVNINNNNQNQNINKSNKGMPWRFLMYIHTVHLKYIH